jgi:electron transfer flavoprotein beta subunit
MRIAVCIKQIPDPQASDGAFYVDEALNEPRWSPPVQQLISTFDLHAIEAAAQLKEQYGGHVTVVSIGPPAVEVPLRRAIARGVDDAVRIDEAAAGENDRFGVATALAAAIHKLGDIDIVLCGRIAADWDMGHVPGMLAELMGIATAMPIKAIRTVGSVAVVERITRDGYEVVQVDLPCLLAVSNELNEPRYPTMRAVLDAQRRQLTTWTPAELGIEVPGERAVGLRRLLGRDLTRACQYVQGSSPEESGQLLASLLHEKALV